MTTTDNTAEIERIAEEMRRILAEAAASEVEPADDREARLASDNACGDRHIEALHHLLAITPTTARGLLVQIDAVFPEDERREWEAARLLAVEGTADPDGGFDSERVIWARCRRVIEGLAEADGSIADLAAKVAVFWREAGDGGALANAMTDPSADAVLKSILGELERLIEDPFRLASTRH